jgi:hypothetical protein
MITWSLEVATKASPLSSASERIDDASSTAPPRTLLLAQTCETSAQVEARNPYSSPMRVRAGGGD